MIYVYDPFQFDLPQELNNDGNFVLVVNIFCRENEEKEEAKEQESWKRSKQWNERQWKREEEKNLYQTKS